jgi:hypothetical protein
MKTATALTFAVVVLAGCAASGDTTTPRVTVAGTSPTGDMTPRAAAVGTSPISPDKQAAFCQDQIAFMYSAEPQFVTTGERVVAADGSTTIDVTVEKGNEGVKTFKCRLDASNRFIDVMARTSDGAL